MKAEFLMKAFRLLGTAPMPLPIATDARRFDVNARASSAEWCVSSLGCLDMGLAERGEPFSASLSAFFVIASETLHGIL